MTNPTSNYSFQMPTATDLVTDLPADFEVFGQAVDTRLKALQPGTTLGDLVYSSATANTSTRLGIGSTAQVLTVTGGVPVWATASAGGMTLLSTTTLSGATTTISSIDQTYTDLALYFHNVRGTNGAFNIAVNALTTSTNTVSVESQNATFVSAVYQDSTIKSASSWAGTGGNANWLALPSYKTTGTGANKPFNCFGQYTTTTGNEVVWNASGIIKTTSAITSLVFGGMTSFTAGTVLLYGVK